MKKLAGGLSGAIGSRYLKAHNQIVFVEYGGYISKLDLVQSLASTVSQGTTTIKGTFLFDCETGTNVGTGPNADFWWEQIDSVKRQIVPANSAQLVNLGAVDFNLVTPASMQSYSYSTAPIIGNNDASNKLVAGDVFCVITNSGNYCKIKVLTYGYDLQVQWVTYKLNPAYTRIGTGYNQPEDIAVSANEQTAYVTERVGNLLRVNLASANRASATVVCTGLNNPQQLWVDEAHGFAYIVEYANPGNLVRVNLANGAKTVLYSGLNFPVGVILSSDLTFAYVSEQGLSAISRIALGTATKISIATGLTAPFFLTWADDSESLLLVPERDPANRVSQVDVTKTTANVKPFITGTSFRPSSITVIQPGTYCVCADVEIDEYFLTVTASGFLYKGIGYVPWNLITAGGKADTTTQPAYPFQFPKDSPFGGTLPVNIDHTHAWTSGIMYYKVKIDGNPRFDVWNDLRMNPANGKYEIIEQMKPDVNGFYNIHNPVYTYYNTDLGCLLPSTSVANGLHSLTVEFYNSGHGLVSTMGNQLFVDNNYCVASLDMPLLDGNHAQPQCGYLKYTDKTHVVTLHYSAYHPMGFANYSFSIIKGAFGLVNESGPLVPNPYVHDYTNTVAALLGSCPTVAAFAESLYVATTVINGVGRQSQYDAYTSVAFCLAP
jgi:hypothetical protein